MNEQATGFNPYMNPPEQPNNMIQFGGYQTPYQQQNQQYVFQPVQQPNNYYNPYATSFGNRANTYNPVGVDYSYGYNQPYYGYGYNSYGYGYQPYQGTASSYQNQYNQRMEMLRTRLRGCNRYFGNPLSEDDIDRMINPANPANRISNEEQQNLNEYHNMLRMHQDAERPTQPPTMYQMALNNVIGKALDEKKQYDSHSLCQFLEEDFGPLRMRDWIEANCIPNNGRNMSGSYNSDQYNELLNLHRSSNPFINQLLDQSRYDNNIDDYEIGMNAVMDRERRRREILNGAVPDFISSPETQKARQEWTQQILDQIYGKELKKSV